MEKTEKQSVNEAVIKAASSENRNREIKTIVPVTSPIKDRVKVEDAQERVPNNIAKEEKRPRPDYWKKLGFHEFLGIEYRAIPEGFPIIGNTQDIHDRIDDQHRMQVRVIQQELEVRRGGPA